jgi:hypothetical protein
MWKSLCNVLLCAVAMLDVSHVVDIPGWAYLVLLPVALGLLAHSVREFLTDGRSV